MAVLAALAVGTCCGDGLEMMRTWLPGPKPWGGTTKRVLLRRICVPAARGVEVLMTILCWIAAEVVTGVLVTVAEGRVGWLFGRTSSEEDESDSLPVPTPPVILKG